MSSGKPQGLKAAKQKSKASTENKDNATVATSNNNNAKSSKSSQKASSTTPAPPLPSNPAELEQVLLGMSAPDTQQVKQSETILRHFLKSADCVLPLLQQITSSQAVVARQLGAVLLRQKINSLWKKLSPEVRTQVQGLLLERLVNEPERLVRLNVAALVSSIAKHTVAINKWPEFFQFLHKMSESNNPAHRETAMLLFRIVSENIGKSMQPHFKVFLTIFARGLQDQQSPRVRIEAVKAISALADFIDTEEEIKAFQHVIEPLLEMLKTCITNPDDEIQTAVTAAFELFERLSEDDTPLIAPQLNKIISFMLEVIWLSFPLLFLISCEHPDASFVRERPHASSPLLSRR
jgi:hypothetical protein